MSNRILVLAFIIGALAVLGMNSVFIVTELERAVLLEFGKVVRDNIKPGLHVKLPVINKVRKFDGRVLTSDAPPERFLTLEKKAVIVDSFAKFKVANVQTYYTATSGDERRAEELLKERINTGLRNEISKRTLHEVVSGERDELMTVLTKSLNTVAQEQLGDVVFVDLPQVGAEVSKGDEIAVVESVKAASEIYAPVSGEVVAVNDVLNEAPETVNADAENTGWFFKIKLADEGELDGLMDADAYAAFAQG